MNVGIIGAGGIALKFHLPELVRIPGVKIVHLAGKEENRLEMLKERFDVPRVSSDYAELLSDPKVEAVVVSVPHPWHVTFGLDVLKAGKHLLMQKPLCGDMAEANAFVEAAQASDKTVMCLPHFSAEVYTFREMLHQGAIGQPSGAYCRVSHGGPEVYYAEVRDNYGEQGGRLWFFDAGKAAVGALFDMGVYAVSSLVAVMGQVKSVTGVVATVAKPTTLEDTASLILQFANGAIGTAETGWCDPAKTWVTRVHGTTGKLTSPGENGAALTRWEPGSYTREDEPATPHAIDVAPNGRGSAHEHWIQCIREGRNPEVSNALVARHVTEILLAGLESSRTGHRIDIHSTL